MSILALRGENANRTAAYPSPKNDTNMAFTLIQAIYSSGISQYLVGALLLAVLALTIGLPPKGGKDERSRTVEWYSHMAMLLSTIAFVAALEFTPYLHDHHFFTVTYTYLAFILTIIILDFNSMLTLDKRKTIEEKWRNKLDLFANGLQLWLLLTFVFGISYAWYHAKLTTPTVIVGSCIYPEIRKMVLFAVERRLNQHPEIFARLAGYVNARFPDYAREHGVANAEAMYLRAHQMLHTESVSMLKLLRDREAEKNKHAMRIKGQFSLVSKKLFERSEPQLVEEIAVYVTDNGEEKAREKYQAEIDRCVGFDNAKQCWRNVASRNAEKRAAKEAEEKAKKQARIDEVREYGREHGFGATKEKFIETPGALGIDPEPFWKKLEEDLFKELVQLLQADDGSKKAFLKGIQLDMFKEAVLRRLDGEWGFGHQEHMDQVLKHSRAFLTTRYGKILEHFGEKAQARFALLCKQMLRSHYQDWQHLLNVRVRVTGSSAMYNIEGLDRHLWHARQQEDQVPMACKRVGLSELEFWGIVREQCEEIQRGLGPRLQI